MPAHINIKKKNTNWWLEKEKEKRKKERANEVVNNTYWINKKSIVATTIALHIHTTSITTLSQNIYFQLWLVTISYYYFISTYKKLTP